MIEIPEDSRTKILELVRNTISESVLDTGTRSEILQTEIYSFRHHGIFVTVYIDGSLRGCIGCMDSSMPFTRALEYAASRASTQDRRFSKIEGKELSGLSFDITILDGMEAISPADDIVIGTHGIYIEHPSGKGILLPQVAEERNWNAGQFLNALCTKAFLPVTALYDPKSTLFRFNSVKISFPDESKQNGNET